MEFEYTDTRYGNLRDNVSAELAGLSDQRLAEALAERNIDAEAMEGFLSDIGKIARKVAPSVLPAAGRLVGGFFGGPAGAAIGGKLGSFAGGAISGRRPVIPVRPRFIPRRPFAPTPIIPAIVPTAPPPIVQVAPVAPTFDPNIQPAAPPPAIEPAPEPIGAGVGSPAASQLLQTITRPEVIQALTSMALGSAGNTDVPVNDTSVPVNAFTNLIGVLANQAEAEYSESMARVASGMPEYMVGESGEALGDPAVEEDRARALYGLLSHEQAEGQFEFAEYGEGELTEGEFAESEYAEAEYAESEYSESEYAEFEYAEQE